MKRRWRLPRLLGVCVVLILLASGCLGVNPPTRVTGFNAPDPAAVNTYWGGAQVYTTNTYFWGVRYNVPTFGWGYTSTSPVPNSTTDALPNLPAWVQRNPLDQDILVWAPAARYLNGKYVLHFGASRDPGAMCIGAATSTNPAGPFSASAGKWCDPLGDMAAGQLDPYIFRDPSDGTVWAYWSRQRFPNGGSQIMVQQLSADGLTRLGSAKVLVDYSDVAGYVPNLGSQSFMENPAMVKDPYNGYNLLVSIGTWHGSSTYHTFEIPCLNRNDLCAPVYGGTLPLSSGGSTNTGGASLLFDATPDDNYLIFHAKTPGYGDNRIAWKSDTYGFESNPPQSRAGGRAAPGGVTMEEFLANAVKASAPQPFPQDAPVWDRPDRKPIGRYDGPRDEMATR